MVASSTTGVPARSAARGADMVDLDVVGMAVAAETVIGGEHVGPFLLDQHVDQRVRRLVDVGRRERHLGRPRRTGPDPLSPRPRNTTAAHAEDGGGLLGFEPPPLRQMAERAPDAVARRGVAGFPVGGEHGDHAMALVGRLRHDSGGEERLIVGVGVEGDERMGHGPSHGRARVGMARDPPGAKVRLRRGAP